jgi:hypothetical protein
MTRLFTLLFVLVFGSAHGQTIQPLLWVNQVGIHGIQGWNLTNFAGEEAAIKTKWADIGNSLTTSSNPFAGTYHAEGNTGYFLRWSPERGFVYAFYHEDYIEAASYGDVVVKPTGIVHFVVTHENQHEYLGYKLKTPTNWIPALEGEYFVRVEEIGSFADFYGGFGDFNGFPRKWNCECDPFPERVSTEKRRQPGFIVPNPYLSQLRRPVYGRIIRIGKSRIGRNPVPFGLDDRASLTAVTINVGRRNGAKPGQLFLISPDKDATDQVLRINRVGKSVSWGTVVRELDDDGRVVRRDLDKENEIKYVPYPELFVGQEIATSFVNKLQ